MFGGPVLIVALIACTWGFFVIAALGIRAIRQLIGAKQSALAT